METGGSNQMILSFEEWLCLQLHDSLDNINNLLSSDEIKELKQEYVNNHYQHELSDTTQHLI